MRNVQLRAFHAVALQGGFSRAAESLFLTQPAISDQVRKLEEEYDILLFNRHKKQVKLTKDGETLLEITRRLFEVEQQALDLLSESRSLRAGHLRIVADSAFHLHGMLSRFRKSHPGVKISVRSGNTEEVLSALYTYEADIGVLGEIPNKTDINIVRLNSSPLIAFVAKGHSLAYRKLIKLEDLVNQPLIVRERGSKTRQKFENAVKKAGLNLSIAIEAEGREAVRELVASGAGVGIVSKAEFGHDMRLLPLPIKGDTIYMNEALICLKERNNSKLVQAFMSLARS